MATTIITKNGSGAPTADDLSVGELAVDLTNKRLYSKNSSNAVIELGVNAAADTTFGDNVKAIFGDGSDLQIYHDGTSNILAGNIVIDGSDASASIASPAALNLKAGDANNEYSTLRLATSADGSLAMIGAKATTTGAYPNSVGQLEFAVQNGASTNTVLTATSTGIDVTGIVTADSVGIGCTPANSLEIQHSTVGTGNGSNNTLALRYNGTTLYGQHYMDANGLYHILADNSGAAGGNMQLDADTTIRFATGSTPTERMRIDSSGNVGIGTASPRSQLDVSDNDSTNGTKVIVDVNSTDVSATNNASFSLYELGTEYGRLQRARDGTGAVKLTALSTQHLVLETLGAGNLYFRTNDTEAMRIDSSGNVGLNGNTNPTGKLHIGSGSGASVSGSADDLVLDQSGNAGLTISTGASAVASIFFADPGSVSAGYVQYTHSNDALAFATQATEAMRIDASGNLLVGTTSQFGATGTTIRADGLIFADRDQDSPLILNRTTSDGDIAVFQKDGTSVGSIGAANGNLYLGQGDTTIMFSASADAVLPKGTDGADRDNAIDLGQATVNRFNDAFITNGVTTGSDGNDKQDIETLSDAEQRVAVACKGLLRKWRWKDAVEAKGDEARTHFGIIAQDLQAAFEAEGLDAGRYAMFMSNTWTDEETGEERTRLGVRYHELLAFIIAAI